MAKLRNIMVKPRAAVCARFRRVDTDGRVSVDARGAPFERAVEPVLSSRGDEQVFGCAARPCNSDIRDSARTSS